MGSNVFANGREVSSKSAGGKAPACFPDVCMTPPENPTTPPGVPVPYPNTGMASDTTKGSRNVKVKNKEVMLKNKSYFKKSMGDEAGSAAKKGVVTSVNRGKVYFNSWSMDVKVEGENVVRHLDLTTHNHGSVPGNTPTWPYIDNSSMGKKVEEACAGDKEKEREACKDFKPYNPTGDDACPDLGGFPSSDEEAMAQAKTVRGNDCLTARKCQLVPRTPRKYEAGCCPGQTPHHLVEAASFYESGRGENSESRGTIIAAAKKDGKTEYREGKAPCICVAGTNQNQGTHGMMHSIQGNANSKAMKPKSIKLANGGKMNVDGLSYAKARNNGAAAVKKAFPDSKCDEECLKAQLDAYHKSEVGITERTPVRGIATGKTSDADATAATQLAASNSNTGLTAVGKG